MEPKNNFRFVLGVPERHVCVHSLQLHTCVTCFPDVKPYWHLTYKSEKFKKNCCIFFLSFKISQRIQLKRKLWVGNFYEKVQQKSIFYFKPILYLLLQLLYIFILNYLLFVLMKLAHNFHWSFWRVLCERCSFKFCV